MKTGRSLLFKNWELKATQSLECILRFSYSLVDDYRGPDDLQKHRKHLIYHWRFPANLSGLLWLTWRIYWLRRAHAERCDLFETGISVVIFSNTHAQPHTTGNQISNAIQIRKLD